MNEGPLETDVLIVGGSSAGINAAISAARRGMEVVLVESEGHLGGSLTTSGEDAFYGFYTSDENHRRIVGGIPWEIAGKLADAGASYERSNTCGAGLGIAYDVEKLKVIFEEMVLKAGVKLLYHTYASKVIVEEDMIRSVMVETKGDLIEIVARYYIDTTGDGNIAAQAGAPFDISNGDEGFENALIAANQHIGERERHRFIGEYMLTEEDVVRAAKFKDAIACCGVPVDDHQPESYTRGSYVQGDGVYQIPYRSLLPKQIDNLIVAGRCLSATHGAQTSARNSAQCMAMGHAAGIAAALCMNYETVFRSIDITNLQAILTDQQAIL